MKCPYCNESMYPSISGPYDEPKLGGQVVHEVCPHCDFFLCSVALGPKSGNVRRLAEPTEGADLGKAA